MTPDELECFYKSRIRVLSGRPSAEHCAFFIEKLYDLYSNDVYRLAYARLRDANKAEDVVQATIYNMLATITGASAGDPQGYAHSCKRGDKEIDNREINLKSYVMKIATNLIHDEFRRVSKRRGHDEEMRRREVLRMDVRQPVEDGSARMALLHCIQQLPEHHQQLIRMRTIQELSYEELAGQLGMNMNTVGVYLHRITVILRDCVMQQLG